MRLFFLLAALFLSAKSSAQVTFSANPQDLDFLKGQMLLFYSTDAGREYIKVFSCAETATVEQNVARLLCDGGIGESWTAQRYPINASSFAYMIYRESSPGNIALDSYVYYIESSGIFQRGSYRQVLANGFSELKPVHMRRVTMDAPPTAAINDRYGNAKVRLSLDPDSIPYLNTVYNTLDIETVQIGIDGPKYRVKMSRVPTEGGYVFKVDSATKK